MPTPASPGTNQYRCNACGRYFNTEDQLRSRAIKTSTSAGRENLREEDSEPHVPNDADK